MCGFPGCWKLGPIQQDSRYVRSRHQGVSMLSMLNAWSHSICSAAPQEAPHSGQNLITRQEVELLLQQPKVAHSPFRFPASPPPHTKCLAQGCQNMNFGMNSKRILVWRQAIVGNLNAMQITSRLLIAIKCQLSKMKRNLGLFHIWKP